MARDKRTYYIQIDQYWQHSPDYFVGPFTTRAAAARWIAQDGKNVWRSDSLCGGDIRTAWRIYPAVLTKTEARRAGMRGDYSNVISPATPLQAHAIDAAVAARSAV